MDTYELTFLLENDEEVKGIKDLLTSLSGKVVTEKKWGALRLAYPIKKLTAANYHTWTIQVNSKNTIELKRKLNFNERLVRYVLLRKES
jgi:small subunit ribosomal protein S6